MHVSNCVPSNSNYALGISVVQSSNSSSNTNPGIRPYDILGNFIAADNFLLFNLSAGG